MASEVTTEVTGEDLADASADAHADGADDTTIVRVVPAAVAARFKRGAGSGAAKVDPVLVAEVAVALTGPGCEPYIVLPGHPAKDGTGGYNLRAAVAAAKGLDEQWFTVREGDVDDVWYWEVTYRTAPTKSRAKVTATAAPDAAPVEDAGDDAGEDEAPAAA